MVKSRYRNRTPVLGQWLGLSLVIGVRSVCVQAEPESATGTLPERVLVEGTRPSDDDKPWNYNRQTRFSHSLPEVDGPRITVTRRTSVEDLSQAPPVIDNAWRELVDRLPSLVMAEQQNPSQLNFSYRGIGNPQESEYVLMLEDGIPMEMDFIGFPTIYYQPFSQSLARIEMIRGGSGLLYGPEAAPVLNFVTQSPTSQSDVTTEQVLGDHGLYSGYVQAQTTQSYGTPSLNAGHRQSAGFRDNGDYQVDTVNLRYATAITPNTQFIFKAHVYQDESGLAGLMSYAQFASNPTQTTTPNDHLWMQREQWVAELDSQLTDRISFVQKVYQQYASLSTRNLSYNLGVAVAQSAKLGIQEFNGVGADGRLLWRWGRGNALTLGYSLYSSHSPYLIYSQASNNVSVNERAGQLSFADQRSTQYSAAFAENVFRFKRFHALLSARVDRENIAANQTLASHPLIGAVSSVKTIPLFGLGLGNDFGKGNESYINVSQGFRPVRYFDISSPNSYLSASNAPKPTHYLNTELGVHGWPLAGLYYDVGAFEVKTKDRIESQHLTQTEVIDVNTGDTRSRGLEAESAIDLARLGWPSLPGAKLEWSQALTLLQATFTQSAIAGQVGKTPAYAPKLIAKSALTYTDPSLLSARLLFTHVGAQYFQDANVMVGTTPAQIPAYSVWDIHANGPLTQHLQWEVGVNNFTDQVYYSRVFLSGGSIEPAPRREVYIGIKAGLAGFTTKTH